MYSGSPILFCTVHFQEFIIVGQKFYLIFRKRFLFAAAFKVQYLNLFCQTFSSRMAYSQWVGIWKKNCRNFIFLNFTFHGMWKRYILGWVQTPYDCFVWYLGISWKSFLFLRLQRLTFPTHFNLQAGFCTEHCSRSSKSLLKKKYQNCF